MATTETIKDYATFIKEQALPPAAPQQAPDPSLQDELSDIDRLRKEILELENQLMTKKNELQKIESEYTEEASQKQQQDAIAAANQVAATV